MLQVSQMRIESHIQLFLTDFKRLLTNKSVFMKVRIQIIIIDVLQFQSLLRSEAYCLLLAPVAAMLTKFCNIRNRFQFMKRAGAVKML